ncbi:hypothetical protein [Kribbella sp. DT2]|uniref:hypothetical protein n=1 Tax=Kribbella sp. DT2 TaxID=3393427 RepID=UPI003CF9962A
MSEFLLLPRAEELRSDLNESLKWNSYINELQDLIQEILKDSEISRLEVVDLQVNDPLPDRFVGLRNGSSLPVSDALDLIVGMAAGDGPYCVLVGGAVFRLVAAWDGAVQVHVGPAAEPLISRFRGREVVVECRRHAPGPEDEFPAVRTSVDAGFWVEVRDSPGDLTMVRERWAYGAYGCRWYVVTSENLVEVAEKMEPRSLLSVFVDPIILELSPEVIDEGVTLFRPPLLPGRVDYMAYPDGFEDLSEVLAHGFTLSMKDSIAPHRSAVMPDPDGEIRMKWQAPAHG